jgi:hypothetical protein
MPFKISRFGGTSLRRSFITNVYWAVMAGVIPYRGRRDTVFAVTRAVPLVVLAVACGGGRVDGDRAADEIARGLAAHDGLRLAAIGCPSRPVKAGDAFACAGVTTDLQPVTIDVTQRGSGNLEWALRGVVLRAAQIRGELLPKLGSTGELRCPRDVMIVAIGAWTRCALADGGQIGHLDVRIDDLQGNESYKLEK